MLCLVLARGVACANNYFVVEVWNAHLTRTGRITSHVENEHARLGGFVPIGYFICQLRRIYVFLICCEDELRANK